MPSIKDVADQVNAKLDGIVQSTLDTAANTVAILAVDQDIRTGINQVNAQLAAINQGLNLGFTNLSQGLFALLEQAKITNTLLERKRDANHLVPLLI